MSRNANPRCPVLAILLFATTAPSAAAQLVVPIDPRHTYLRRNADPAPEPAARTLASLGLVPGDIVRMRRLGDHDNGPGGDEFGTMIAVFSSSATLLDASQQARVPGAIDAGCDFATSATWVGALPTDIAQDFAIAIGSGVTAVRHDVVVIVPAGATHLFVCAHDSQYFDNTDPDRDFAVELTVLGPTRWELLGGGVAGSNGVPRVTPSGELVCGASIAFAIATAPPNAPVLTAIGARRQDAAFFGGVLVPELTIVSVIASSDALGDANVVIPVPIVLAAGTQLWFQHLMLDAAGPRGIAMTDGVRGVSP